jgi:hypothetical protein
MNEYLDKRDHAERLAASADKMLPRYAEALRRLGQ